MRERHREIARRRQRYAKRKKLRKRLDLATTDQERAEVMARIRKTIPKYISEA